MSGAARVNTDRAGGKIIKSPASTVFVNGDLVAVKGSDVENHAAHNNVTMVEASSTVFADGVAICREGDAASCGHKATGSSNVFVG